VVLSAFAKPMVSVGKELREVRIRFEHESLYHTKFSLQTLNKMCCYLLCISGLDDTENFEIYETYMHFGQISDNGKISPDISCP